MAFKSYPYPGTDNRKLRKAIQRDRQTFECHHFGRKPASILLLPSFSGFLRCHASCLSSFLSLVAMRKTLSLRIFAASVLAASRRAPDLANTHARDRHVEASLWYRAHEDLHSDVRNDSHRMDGEIYGKQR
jgi:hypothetical protein